MESEIYAAFIRLYNKLFYNYKQILVLLQTALQELKIRRFNGNPNVIDIHKDIAKLKEQTHVLARLKTKGSCRQRISRAFIIRAPLLCQ